MMMQRHGGGRPAQARPQGHGSWFRTFGLVLLLPALVFLVPGAASGADPIARFSVSGQAGGALFDPSDVNAGIREGNRFLSHRQFKTLDEITYGFNFTLDVRAKITNSIAASLGGGTVFAQTGVDFDEVIDVEPSVSFYHVRLTYLLPWRPMPSMMLHLGAGPVYFQEGETKVRRERREVELGTVRVETARFRTERTWGGHVFLQNELVFNNRITLITDLGYRFASLTGAEWDNNDWTLDNMTTSTGAQDSEPNGIPDVLEFSPDGYSLNSFLERSLRGGDPTTPEIDGEGRPVYKPRGGTDLDLSGVLLNVGLRFYLF